MSSIYHVIHRRRDVRAEFHEHVSTERDVFEASLDDAQRVTFTRIKIGGILGSGLGVVVTYDPARSPLAEAVHHDRY